MARLGTGYARYFNERHDRVGHLFQNRFRSRHVVDDRDLIGLIRYVCRNPLDGGLVADSLELEDFPWCGLGALTGRRAPRAFESVPATLALFDRDPECARRQLREHLGAPPLDAPPTEVESQLAPPANARNGEVAALVREICRSHGVSRESCARADAMRAWPQHEPNSRRARSAIWACAEARLRASSG
jgi:hypothetical protein